MKLHQDRLVRISCTVYILRNTHIEGIRYGQKNLFLFHMFVLAFHLWVIPVQWVSDMSWINSKCMVVWVAMYCWNFVLNADWTNWGVHTHTTIIEAVCMCISCLPLFWCVCLFGIWCFGSSMSMSLMYNTYMVAANIWSIVIA